MSASLLLRSAGRALRRSVPQGSLHRSPVRLLSGSVGRIKPNEHSNPKPNIRNTKRTEDGHVSFCRGAEHHRELEELASDLRAVRDKLRATEQTVLQHEKWDNQRERVLVCASILLVAYWVFS